MSASEGSGPTIPGSPQGLRDRYRTRWKAKSRGPPQPFPPFLSLLIRRRLRRARVLTQRTPSMIGSSDLREPKRRERATGRARAADEARPALRYPATSPKVRRGCTPCTLALGCASFLPSPCTYRRSQSGQKGWSSSSPQRRSVQPAWLVDPVRLHAWQRSLLPSERRSPMGLFEVARSRLLSTSSRC